ncbi:MAG: ATP-binding protein [Bacteroidota bacterium]
MNKLLQRQLKRVQRKHSTPEDQLDALIQVIDSYYEESDRARRKKDRSVSLMSEELLELNKKILAKSEAYISAIMENVADGIIITQDTYEISSFNQAAEQMFGYLKEDINVLSFEKLLSEESLEKFSGIKEAYSQSEFFQLEGTELELYGKARNGREFPMEISINPVSIDDEGFFLMILKDISRRKRYQAELMEAKVKAEIAAEEKTRFLSNMSHEIRTPMNAVIGLTNLLIENDPRDDQKEMLRTINFSGNNLLVIINDILDFNKIDAGKVELESIPFSLKEISGSIRSALMPKAADKGIDLSFEMDANLPSQLKGDPVRMSQILTNLVNNAVKFTLEGGVRFIVKEKGRTEDKVELYFAVQDTGIGIPEDKLDHIFESFSQSNSNTTRKFGGTGLGLAICKELVDLHGGELKVSSQLGKGSTFYFTLEFPLIELDSPSQQQETIKKDKKIVFSGLEGLNVLLVEDNKINQMVASRYLKKWKISYQIANNGVEACDKILVERFDIVLMDLHMPERDGYEATRVIRANQEAYYKEVPIIALTASVVGDINREVQEAGMNAYVSKPFQPADLYSTMLRQLGVKV